VCVCVVMVVFAEPHSEGSFSLSDVCFVAIGASQFVYSGHLVFVSGVVVSVFTYGVVGGIALNFLTCIILLQFHGLKMTPEGLKHVA
jgi:hypothetical protein